MIDLWKIPCGGRQREYYTILLTMLAKMLEYPDLTEKGKIEMDTLVFSAGISGTAGVCKIDGKWKCGTLAWVGPLDDNGISEKCVLHGRTWTEELPTDQVAYYRANWLQQPEPLKWFAGMFTDTDSAQRALIRNTKYVPVPVASNRTEKTEYENVLRAIQEGQETTVMVRPQSCDILRDSGQKESDRVLSISDPTMIEKMHFLSEYHSELKKRFATLYGMCFRSSSKSAQESVDEVHGMDNFTLIIPRAKRDEMRLFADKCKKLWGWAGSESVDFSELWQREDQSAAISSGEMAEQENSNQTEKEGEEDVRAYSEN